MGKPIKEWGVFKFLTKKLPAAAGDIIGAAADIATGKNPVKVIGDLVSGHDELTKEDLQTINRLMARDLEEQKLIFADKADARNMQIQALQQSDTFAKRFVYYFAAGITLFAFLLIGLMFFVEIPRTNTRIIDMALGAVIGTGLITIIQFFFGSSTGSKEKESQIKDLLDGLK